MKRHIFDLESYSNVQELARLKLYRSDYLHSKDAWHVVERKARQEARIVDFPLETRLSYSLD